MMKTIKKVELRTRRVLIASENKAPHNTSISSPASARNAVLSLLKDEAHEVFIALMLDVKNRIIGYTEAGRGDVDTCPVSPRAVFRAAVMNGTSSIIIAHNHPSGDPTPSDEDDCLTKRLKNCSDILGIKILDHIVVCDDSYYSYLEHGRL